MTARKRSGGWWGRVWEWMRGAAPGSAVPDVQEPVIGGTEPGKFLFSIDEPVHWRVPGPTLTIAGWCLRDGSDPAAPVAVRARIGSRSFHARTTLRPDVAAAFPDKRGAADSGFSVEVVPDGERTEVILEAQGMTGWTEFFRSEIVIDRAAALPGVRRYADWAARYDTPAPAHLAELAAKVSVLGARPRFRVLFIGDPRDPVSLGSLAGQVWRGFETDPLAPVVDGDWVVVLGAGDRLAPHALARMTFAIAEHPEARWIYSDEDVWPADGLRRDPWFKPDWDPDLHEEIDYICRLAAVRGDVWLAAGTVNLIDWERWWETAHVVAGQLRADEIVHVPHVLYHRASATVSLQRPVTRGAAPAVAVSVVIPTRDRADLLDRCVRAVLESAECPRLEVVLVDHGTREQAALALLNELARDTRVRLLRVEDGAFNFSALVNAGEAVARGDVVVLLNNDIEPVMAGWLHALVAAALRPGIGCVGARLDYLDGRIQHVGVALGVHGVAAMPFRGAPGDTRDPAGRTWAAHRVAAVTAACLAVRRETWDAVGGFDALDLPVSFNDVDFCLRVAGLGLRNLVLPAVRLLHHESATRGAAPNEPRAAAEFALMRARWGLRLAGDPAYNPNLTVDSESAAPAFPPRVPPAWSSGMDASTETAELDAQLAVRRLVDSAKFRADLKAFLATPEVFNFQPRGEPVVSVLLVLHNRADLTLRCLRALCRSIGPALELVIVDNSSTDETAQLLERVCGATVIRNPENRHFLAAANQAASVARGRLVLFLNNDAEVAEDAIAHAVEALDRDRLIGAVGGKLVWPDGRLQEAGCVVWGDARTQGVGRGDDPARPEHNFRRPVDYVSGAFLLTPRELFADMGGFDELFGPAYFEEVDFCIRLWQRGRPVIFEPQSEVLHHEFSSSTPQIAAGLQERNRRVFAEKHSAWLAGRPEASALALLKWRTTGTARAQVLVLEDRIPLPHHGAGFPRTIEMLRALAALGCRVTVGAMRMPPGPLAEIYEVLPREVEVADLSEGLASFLAARLGTFDTLIVCRPQNFQAVVELRARTPALLSGMRLIYDAEAVFARRTISQAALGGCPFSETEARDLIGRELARVAVADVVLSVSPAEAEEFTAHGAREVEVLGHACEAVTPEERPPWEERSGLLYVGSFHADATPNADALNWFVRDVLPLLPESIALRVVGEVSAPSVRALEGPRVRLIGRVADLRSEYDRARVFVAPGRFGAGIPLKVVEAAAAGLPVVLTPLLAGQLAWTNGGEALVASDAAGFAAAVVQLHGERESWDRVRLDALEAVRRDYSRERFEAALRRVLPGG